MATVTSNLQALIARLTVKANAAGPDSPQLKAALTRIGATISAEATLNVRRRGLIDTGRLINSIKFELFVENNVQGVKVGSYNVPYAAIHEFGFQGSVSVRSYSRTLTQVFGKRVNPRIVDVRPHERFMRIPARSYLRPAVQKYNNMIIDVLRQAMRGES
jgi:phage gpG-like protein